jgi:hypothetical protein
MMKDYLSRIKVDMVHVISCGRRTVSAGPGNGVGWTHRGVSRGGQDRLLDR